MSFCVFKDPKCSYAVSLFSQLKCLSIPLGQLQIILISYYCQCRMFWLLLLLLFLVLFLSLFSKAYPLFKGFSIDPECKIQLKI